MPYEAIVSNQRKVATHYEIWKWAGRKVVVLPETLTDVPQLDKKRVNFIPLSASPEEVKKPLSIVTDFLIPLSPGCEAILQHR